MAHTPILLGATPTSARRRLGQLLPELPEVTRAVDDRFTDLLRRHSTPETMALILSCLEGDCRKKLTVEERNAITAVRNRIGRTYRLMDQLTYNCGQEMGVRESDSELRAKLREFLVRMNTEFRVVE
ncbi:hypothetical protein HZC07_01375 [Candidatus Micrarchaeota archaeon]|nr:hypothetical protein [Candidatus Micrarchaeota archaeon]